MYGFTESPKYDCIIEKISFAMSSFEVNVLALSILDLESSNMELKFVFIVVVHIFSSIFVACITPPELCSVSFSGSPI